MESGFLVRYPGRSCIQNEDFCSVAICSFNRHDLLEKVIDSVHQHADMPFEIVVSDDGGRLYSDFNFFNRIKNKVSRICINTGRNMGLGANFNSALLQTHADTIIALTDDAVLTKPIMRRVKTLVNSASYVGIIYISSEGARASDNNSLRSMMDAGLIQCQSNGIWYSLYLTYAGSWGSAFSRKYLFETGGFGEDDVYGDFSIGNRGWKKGYFSCMLDEGPFAHDIDKDENGLTHRTTSKFLDAGVYCNYPHLFGVNDNTLKSMGVERNALCCARNGDRTTPFGDHYTTGWADYMKDALQGGVINFDKLSKHHGRFLDDLRRDAIVSF